MKDMKDTAKELGVGLGLLQPSVTVCGELLHTPEPIEAGQIVCDANGGTMGVALSAKEGEVTFLPQGYDIKSIGPGVALTAQEMNKKVIEGLSDMAGDTIRAELDGEITEQLEEAIEQSEAFEKLDKVFKAKVARGGRAQLRRGDVARVLGISAKDAAELLRKAAAGGLVGQEDGWWHPMMQGTPNDYLRLRQREDGFARRILPPEPVSPADLTIQTVRDSVVNAMGVPKELMNGPAVRCKTTDLGTGSVHVKLEMDVPQVKHFINAHIDIPKEASND